MNRSAVIVAGGSGTRMNSDIPKQFLLLQGRPILMHTLEAFHHFDAAIDLVLVLPADQLDSWSDLCRQHSFSVPHRLTAGGETRFHSVKNGLELVSDSHVVGIHDGVRPLVNSATLQACYNGAEENESAIPVTPVTDSLRRITPEGNQSVLRSAFRSVQTPQCFQTRLLIPCYNEGFREDFTDDASVFEAAGNKINLVEGNSQNIKITTPQDLMLAEALLKSKA